MSEKNKIDFDLIINRTVGTLLAIIGLVAVGVGPTLFIYLLKLLFL